MHAAQIRDKITGQIVKALESGRKPWKQPWRNDPNSGYPTSMSSKKEYRGINPILLTLACWEKEYAGKWWGTFKQWKELGAAVKPGEKATWVVLFKQCVKKAEEGSGDDDIKYSLMTQFPVFCIDQVAGAAVDRFRPDNDSNNQGEIDYSNADALIGACPISIKHGGNQAAYLKDGNKSVGIRMPYKSKFKCEEQYYSTIFHELSHWADHRLGAAMSGKMGSEDYFFGELVAEISACYLCEHCRIPAVDRIEDSQDYINSWIKKMGKDNTYILKASSRASKVADFVLGHIKQPVTV